MWQSGDLREDVVEESSAKLIKSFTYLFETKTNLRVSPT